MTPRDDNNDPGKNLIWELTEAIANSEGVEPAELDFQLAEYINVDAVKELADDQNSTWTLTFELSEQHVTMTNNRTILVSDNEENN